MKTASIKYQLIFLVPLLFGCGGKNTSSNVDAPGDQKTAKDKVLTTGADILQDKTPLKGFDTYLDGFHFYNGNMDGQMEAHHYVNQINEDMYQAVIFDGNGPDAKLMGIEYIVTEKLFKTLPKEEKLLWHSHKFEVSSGSLLTAKRFIPGIPIRKELCLLVLL
jgi:hypothetical protein